MQHSTVHYSTAHNSTPQHSTVLYYTAQRSKIQSNTSSIVLPGQKKLQYHELEKCAELFSFSPRGLGPSKGSPALPAPRVRPLLRLEGSLVGAPSRKPPRLSVQNPTKKLCCVHEDLGQKKTKTKRFRFYELYHERVERVERADVFWFCLLGRQKKDMKDDTYPMCSWEQRFL